MTTRLLALIRKEFIQTFRDVAIVALVIYSFAEIILCGWAVTMEIRHIPTAVLDRDNSPTSRALLQRFERSSNFHLDFYPASEQGVEGLLDSGQALLGLIIPPGLSQEVATG